MSMRSELERNMHTNVVTKYGFQCNNNSVYHKPIYDTPFELHLFWSSDTERRIKLMFSESVSLSFKTRLLTLLMMTLL